MHVQSQINSTPLRTRCPAEVNRARRSGLESNGACEGLDRPRRRGEEGAPRQRHTRIKPGNNDGEGRWAERRKRERDRYAVDPLVRLGGELEGGVGEQLRLERVVDLRERGFGVGAAACGRAIPARRHWLLLAVAGETPRAIEERAELTVTPLRCAAQVVGWKGKPKATWDAALFRRRGRGVRAGEGRRLGTAGAARVRGPGGTLLARQGRQAVVCKCK